MPSVKLESLPQDASDPFARQQVLLGLLDRADDVDGAAIAQMALTLSSNETNARNMVLCLQLLESLAKDRRIPELDPKAFLAMGILKVRVWRSR